MSWSPSSSLSVGLFFVLGVISAPSANAAEQECEVCNAVLNEVGRDYYSFSSDSEFSSRIRDAFCSVYNKVNSTESGFDFGVAVPDLPVPFSVGFSDQSSRQLYEEYCSSSSGDIDQEDRQRVLSLLIPQELYMAQYQEWRQCMVPCLEASDVPRLGLSHQLVGIGNTIVFKVRWSPPPDLVAYPPSVRSFAVVGPATCGELTIKPGERIDQAERTQICERTGDGAVTFVLSTNSTSAVVATDLRQSPLDCNSQVFDACGGDPKGVWEIVESCISTPPPPSCPGQATEVAFVGSIQLGADALEKVDVTSVSDTYNPRACFEGNPSRGNNPYGPITPISPNAPTGDDIQSACTRLEMMMNGDALLGLAPPARPRTKCVPKGEEGCVCRDRSQTLEVPENAATYKAQNGKLRLQGGEKLDYCVASDIMTWRDKDGDTEFRMRFSRR